MRRHHFRRGSVGRREQSEAIEIEQNELADNAAESEENQSWSVSQSSDSESDSSSSADRTAESNANSASNETQRRRRARGARGRRHKTPIVAIQAHLAPPPPAPKVLILRSSSRQGERIIEGRDMEARLTPQETPVPVEHAVEFSRHSRVVQGRQSGIKAQNEEVTHWWSKRWLEFLDDPELELSLAKGRVAARRGAVSGIELDVGSVQATVHGQGERFEVELALEPIDEDSWDRIIDRILDEPIYAARLLAGELPEEIESVFEDEGCHLFPRDQEDLAAGCSCSESGLCQHIAAVYLLLAEEFERDPFLLFRLRGRERADLLDELSDPEPIEEEQERLKPLDLPSDPEKFYGQPVPMPKLSDLSLPASLAANLPRRLGAFPFWRGSEPFLDAMDAIYATVSLTTLNTVLRDRAEVDLSVLQEERPSRFRRRRRERANAESKTEVVQDVAEIVTDAAEEVVTSEQTVRSSVRRARRHRRRGPRPEPEV